MSRTITVAKLPDFDVTELLQSEQDIAEYLTLVIEDGDTGLLAATLGDIARARGMTQLAQQAGIGRESLYKALRPDASPRFDTLIRVFKALGVKLVAQPAY